MKNLLGMIVLLFGCLSFVACSSSSDDNPEVVPEKLSVGNLGGSLTASIGDESWNIAYVENISGTIKSKFVGTIYSQVKKDSTQLSLAGLGSIATYSKYSGFKITRSTASSLTIDVNENLTSYDFIFSIVLTSGNQTKRINVSQPKSDGYTAQGITFKASLKDSVYLDSLTAYTGAIVKIQPITSVNTSLFNSDNANAFLWTNTNAPNIIVPYSNENGVLTYKNMSFKYSDASQEIIVPITTSILSVDAPADKNKCSVWVEKRKVSAIYTLTLKNNTTSALRTVQGSWEGHIPTGNYTLKWVYSNLSSSN